MSVRALTRADPALRRRRILSWSVVASLLGIVTVSTLTLGEMNIPLGDALRALFGIGEPGIVLVVREWRGPPAPPWLVVAAGLRHPGAAAPHINPQPPTRPHSSALSTGALPRGLLGKYGREG